MKKKQIKFYNTRNFRVITYLTISVILIFLFLPHKLKCRLELAKRNLICQLFGNNSKCDDILSYDFTVDPIYGIDVSTHQGKIDWSKVSSYKDRPISFVYIKASEGATRKDKRYAYNLEKAREKGFLVGSYHYFKANRTAESQFYNFAATAEKNKQDLLPVVDVEEIVGATRSEFHERLTQFLKLVENHYGKKPIIYSQNHFFNLNLADKYDVFPLMIARYHKEKPEVKSNIDWTIWQFTEKGRVDGISGNVDINILNNVDFELNELKL